jgi:hypothetical protein
MWSEGGAEAKKQAAFTVEMTVLGGRDCEGDSTLLVLIASCNFDAAIQSYPRFHARQSIFNPSIHVSCLSRIVGKRNAVGRAAIHAL